jgi:hypothetical protein
MSKEVLSHREAVRKYKADRKANIPPSCQWCNTCGMARPNADFSFGYKTCNRHHEKAKPKSGCTLDEILGVPLKSKIQVSPEPEKKMPNRGKPKGECKKLTKDMIDQGYTLTKTGRLKLKGKFAKWPSPKN